MSLPQFLRQKKKFGAKVIVLFFACNLLGSMIAPALQANENIYTQISKLYIPSLAKQEIEEEVLAKQTKEKNEELLEKQTKNFDIELQELGKVEKLRLLYNILSLEESEKKPNILKPNVFDDLEVYCGNKPHLENHLFSHLDHTQTATGKIEYQAMLKPTADIAELKKRQKIVKELIENESLFNTLDEKIKIFKKAENDLIWFWKKLDREAKKYFNQVYFGKFCPCLNKSEIALEISTLWKYIGSPTLGIIITFLPIFILPPVGLGFYYLQEKKFPPIKKGVKQVMQDIPGTCKSIWKEFIMPLYFSYLRKNRSIPETVISISFCTLALYGSYRLLSSIIPTIVTHNKISNDIQSRLINVATCTNTIKDITSILEANEIFKKYTKLVNSSNKNLDSAHNYKTTRFLNTLQKNTFKGQPSIFSHKGRALATFKKIPDLKDTLISELKTIGQVDAYLSIAKLYKKHANHKSARFSFANYIEQDKPYLNIVDGWNPILNPDIAVTNSIKLGNPGKESNVILTGPNAGGKSTFLKMNAISVMLAQSLGIAPTREITLTPFSLIDTYLNIADIQGKKSLFQAEMHRTRNLLNAVKDLKDDEFAFVIMDEIFTGTNPKEGMAGAYGVAKMLSNFKNSIAIVATHFEALTNLETDTNGSYANYKVSVNKKPDGIEFLYKLKPGITDQAIGLDLLQEEGFDNEILQTALDIIKRGQLKKQSAKTAIAA